MKTDLNWIRKHLLSQKSIIIFENALCALTFFLLYFFTLFSCLFFLKSYTMALPASFSHTNPFRLCFLFSFTQTPHAHRQHRCCLFGVSWPRQLTMKHAGNVRDPLNLNPSCPALPAAHSSSSLSPNIHLQPQTREGCQAPLCRPVWALQA